MHKIHEHIDLHEIARLVETVKRESKQVNNGRYDVQPFANNLYSKLNNTNGYSSLDLAAYLLLNNRKLGVAFVNGQQ